VQQPTENRRVLQPTTITNVVATLRGTQNPERVYVVSGHYDSMCTSPSDATCDAPGANDDASGTAAVIEMARVMSKRKFEATIIFMAVAGEEQGLLGATYFAEQAKQKQMNVEAMFTNDIIGGVTTQKNSPDRNSVRVFSEGVPSNETEQEAGTRRSVGGENDSASRQLARFIKETADLYSPKFRVMMIYRRDRYGRGGDHIPFVERGFAAVRFTEPNEDYDHQHQNLRTENGKFYGDTIEFVDFEYVANVTGINTASLARLANAPARPKNVGIVTGRLGNDTELKWDANAENDVAGYEIVWRDTTSAVWTNSQAVGNVTNFVMKNMSKDNYFFGVRSVDKDGNRSPASLSATDERSATGSEIKRLSHSSAATRTGACRASETMRGCFYFSIRKSFGRKIENRLRNRFRDADFQHLVKIAVEKISEPINADCVRHIKLATVDGLNAFTSLRI
jgi:hypothetical protein